MKTIEDFGLVITYQCTWGNCEYPERNRQGFINFIRKGLTAEQLGLHAEVCSKISGRSVEELMDMFMSEELDFRQSPVYYSLGDAVKIFSWIYRKTVLQEEDAELGELSVLPKTEVLVHEKKGG